MVFGEYLTGVSEGEGPEDFRGAVWIDLPGLSQIYTRSTPNSTTPDVFFPTVAASAARAQPAMHHW